jgi:hypothetical protein
MKRPLHLGPNEVTRESQYEACRDVTVEEHQESWCRPLVSISEEPQTVGDDEPRDLRRQDQSKQACRQLPSRPPACPERVPRDHKRHASHRKSPSPEPPTPVRRASFCSQRITTIAGALVSNSPMTADGWICSAAYAAASSEQNSAASFATLSVISADARAICSIQE